MPEGSIVWNFVRDDENTLRLYSITVKYKFTWQPSTWFEDDGLALDSWQLTTPALVCYADKSIFENNYVCAPLSQNEVNAITLSEQEVESLKYYLQLHEHGRKRPNSDL